MTSVFLAYLPCNDECILRTHLPSYRQRARFKVERADVLGMMSRSVGGHAAPALRGSARPAAPDAVLQHDPERIIRPRRQNDAVELDLLRVDVTRQVLLAVVACLVLAPRVRRERRVVLDGVARDWRVVLVRQSPADGSAAIGAVRQVHVCWWVRHI